MTTEANEVVSQEAIEAETERLIQKAAERNGLSADSIREQVQVEAREQAKKNLEQAAKDENNPYRKLYEAERAQRKIAEDSLANIRTNAAKHSDNTRPLVTAEQARRRAGELQWNHKLSVSQKIATLGVEPASVNLEEVQKLFGRGSDLKLALDLHKSDPARYRQLREVAKVAGIY